MAMRIPAARRRQAARHFQAVLYQAAFDDFHSDLVRRQPGCGDLGQQPLFVAGPIEVTRREIDGEPQVGHATGPSGECPQGLALDMARQPSARPTDSARANSTSALSTALQRASASTPTIWPLAGSICGWKRSSIRSRRMAASRARSRRGEAGAGIVRSDARCPPNIGQCHPRMEWPYAGQGTPPNAPFGRAPFRDSGATREMPMLWPVNATRSSSASPERDLAAHGIGLVASTGQAAQAAEALLRRRYSWAEADAAQTLVALGGDGFMLQTLHAMLEEGEARPVFGMNRGTFGFLMNDWRLDRLYERIQDAKHIRVTPLAMAATDIHGQAGRIRRSMKSRCCARRARPRRSRFASTAGW